MSSIHPIPCFDALRLLFGSSETNGSIILLDYRSRETFTALWLQSLDTGKLTISEQEIDLTDGIKQILIIGNDPPDGIFDTNIPALAGINFRSHFTATSWLAAWKVKFSPTQQEKDEKKAAEANTRIAVIDPRPAGMAQGAAHALQTILGARDIIGQSLVPGAVVLKAPSLSDICIWLKPTKPDTRTVAKDAPHLRDLLKSTIWNDLTSDHEQHHALSNILGPVILSGKPEPPMLNHETLLRRLLSACGLVSWENKNQGDKEAEPSETGQGLQILLLDDQAKQGWEEWSKECLPGAAAGLKTIIDPTELVEAITKALDPEMNDDRIITGYKSKDARFRLNLPELGDATHPVLLLDLRLFSGKEDVERKFLKDKLLPLVNHFTDKPDLAWPSFSITDLFQRAWTAVDNGTLKPDTDEHHEVLTWLPRVVALADMSLPIILFSSTGRRDLIEPFKPYGNIITSFEKPRLNDLASLGKTETAPEIRVSTDTSLSDAVALARRWLAGREAAKRIQHTNVDSLDAARSAFSTKTHFEIYHDESGNVEQDAYKVASLLVGFDDPPAGNKENNAFPIRFCWGKEPPQSGGKTPDDNSLEKSVKGISKVQRWNNTIKEKIDFEKTPMLLAIAARGKDIETAGGSSSIFDPGGLDNINWDLLTLQWESLLADVLPALLEGREKKDITIAIYGATRFRAITLTAREPEHAINEAKGLLNTMRSDWGIELRDDDENRYVNDSTENENIKLSAFGNGELVLLRGFQQEDFTLPFKLLWRSLQRDSFWKLAADALIGRKESEHYSKVSKAIQRVLGITLRYGDKYPDAGARRLHYMADVLAGLANIDAEKQNISVEASPFNKPTHKALVAFRSRILSILNANRLLDLGNCDSEALGVFDWLAHTPDKVDIAYLALAERLKKMLPALQGSDMIRLVTFLENPAEWMDKNRILVRERKVTSRTVL